MVRPSAERAWSLRQLPHHVRLGACRVLLEFYGPTVADRPDVGDLCFAFLGLPVKSEVIVAESHNSLAAVALKDLVHVKDEFVKTRR